MKLTTPADAGDSACRDRASPIHKRLPRLQSGAAPVLAALFVPLFVKARHGPDAHLILVGLVASTKPGSGDPGDLAGGVANAGRGVRGSTKPGSGDPGDPGDVAVPLSPAVAVPLLQRSRGPETPGTRGSGELRTPAANRFNEAGVRRPRGPPGVRLTRLVVDDASTKPGSGDPGDPPVGRDVRGTGAMLQRSRGPETPGTFAIASVPYATSWKRQRSRGPETPGRRDATVIKMSAPMKLQRSRGPETPGTREREAPRARHR